eukprot:g15744.t1
MRRCHGRCATAWPDPDQPTLEELKFHVKEWGHDSGWLFNQAEGVYFHSASGKLFLGDSHGALQADGGRWLGMVTELRRVVQPLRVFKAHEGFGFIDPDGQQGLSGDVYVHHSALQQPEGASASTGEGTILLMEAEKRWCVVGGADKGGILVRQGQALSSPEADKRLGRGALVREVELAGERLCFQLLSGEGPETGWVSIKLKDKAKVYGAPKPLVESSRKIRVLCLHGTAATEKFTDLCQEGCIDCDESNPIVAKQVELMKQYFPGEKFKQWAEPLGADGGWRRYDKWEPAMKFVQEIMTKMAPIDVLLGFSQGSNLSHPLAACAGLGQGPAVNCVVVLHHSDGHRPFPKDVNEAKDLAQKIRDFVLLHCHKHPRLTFLFMSLTFHLVTGYDATCEVDFDLAVEEEPTAEEKSRHAASAVRHHLDLNALCHLGSALGPSARCAEKAAVPLKADTGHHLVGCFCGLVLGAHGMGGADLVAQHLAKDLAQSFTGREQGGTRGAKAATMAGFQSTQQRFMQYAQRLSANSARLWLASECQAYTALVFGPDGPESQPCLVLGDVGFEGRSIVLQQDGIVSHRFGQGLEAKTEATRDALKAFEHGLKGPSIHFPPIPGAQLPREKKGFGAHAAKEKAVHEGLAAKLAAQLESCHLEREEPGDTRRRGGLFAMAVNGQE